MKNQKGVSLYISIMIMAIILSIVLGVTTILLGQLKVIKGIENSVVAFYAAETGIEQVLMNRVAPVNLNGALSNGATYNVDVSSGCGAANFCIKSVGNFRNAQRTIQITY
ncbi:hypothetical protein KKA24_03275 [Patescibacteria group bacterium]|nr:hypothetical protein [Patescibacteria group bacterium]